MTPSSEWIVAPQGLRDDIVAGLLAFGYAPGNYMGTCSRCERTISDVDKRTRICWECAIMRAIERSNELLDIERTPKPTVAPEVMLAEQAKVYGSVYEANRAHTTDTHDQCMVRAREAAQNFAKGVG